MRRFFPFVLGLAACQPAVDPGPVAELAGRWEAESVVPGSTDVLELDEHGEGTATLLRRTSAIFAVEGDVVVVANDAGSSHHEQFDMSLRCNARQFGCETYDFDALCMLEGDALRCEAPEWYHDPNWIEFHPVD